MTQMVLMLTTEADDLRSKAIGWTCEDPSLLRWGTHIGCTPSVSFRYTYETPLHALAAGWKLLAPPELNVSHSERTFCWTLVFNKTASSKQILLDAHGIHVGARS